MAVIAAGGADVALSDVQPLTNGLWLATCECGEEHRFRTQEQAWRWLLDHVCYLDQQAE